MSIEKTVILPDGTALPRLGQGTWYMGDDSAAEAEEISTLRQGIDLGMTLIDTAEMYGNGRSEVLVGKAIKGIRDRVFLVSKVLPHNAGGSHLISSCESSLKRLGIDCLDLYLLHWRGQVPYAETVRGMEELIRAGKIKRWGVSNLDDDDMRELLSEPGAESCAVNQVLYHLGSRGIEYDLLPWQRQNHMPVMAYCPLAQAGQLRRNLVTDATLRQVAAEHNADPFQILLAWCIRQDDILAIPKAASLHHVTQNAAAADIVLSREQLQRLDQAFPAPNRPVPLDIV
ncbi:aldo/keto reductase [Pelobacter seleniigenes]|uniref:aldo/keto reductase n=1 Tax=Pelobacter seleniigenes TaxID=407188 RepID=UPI0004A6B8AB|nr:aldo/keto reductase [Pelobacter seleniigenes]